MNTISNPAEICPVDVELELNGKTYTLKKWSLKVDAWVEARFGRKKDQLFQNLSSEELGKLVFHLISNKKDFQAEMLMDWDDEGKPIERFQTGPERIMDAISGSEKEEEVVKKILECYGLAVPLINNLMDDGKKQIAEVAKKKTKAQKKIKKSIGAQSLT